MTQEDVHTIAKGRVWSGEDALEIDLIDEIGGFIDAIDKAAEMAGVEEGGKVRLVYYPKRKTGLEALDDLFGVSTDIARAASVIGAIAGDERLNAAVSSLQLGEGEFAQVRGPILIEN